MKLRLVVATVLAAGLALSVSGAQAAPPVLDGKNVKSLTKTLAGGAQQNLLADETACEEPNCLTLPFVYKPAKGVKGGLLFTANWTNPLSDLDLYVVEVDTKKKTETTIANCGGTASNKESIYLAPAELRPGKTYRMVVVMWVSLNETVTGKVQINVPNPIGTTVPAAVDDAQSINCTL